jgi:hypothetical protein
MLFPFCYPNIWSKRVVLSISHQTKTEVDKVMPKEIRNIFSFICSLKRDFIVKTQVTSKTKITNNPIGPKNQLGITGLFITENDDQEESVKMLKNITIKKVMVHLVSLFSFSFIFYSPKFCSLISSGKSQYKVAAIPSTIPG